MMREVALRSLTHDRGKLFGAVAGVTFAAALLLIQVGIYEGFRATSAMLIDRLGGDVWVMAGGTEVVDSGEPLSGGSRARVAALPCVRDVRGVVFAFGPMRKPNGAIEAVQVVGVDPSPTSALVPWSLEHGLPSDLRAQGRVSVDGIDLGKLHLPADPRGSRVSIGVEGPTVEFAAVTRGIRSFTLTPYIFAELTTARRLTNLGSGQVHYWLLDLEDRACAPLVAALAEARSPDLKAMDSPSFREKTIDYWVGGSGAGAAIGFSALLGLIVGTVIVGQTLYSVTREHERELATLKAIGATRFELASFVAWQAALLALVGVSIGFGLSVGGQRLLEGAGLMVVLSPRVLVAVGLAVLGMCAAASLGSVRKVLRLDAAEVFK